MRNIHLWPHRRLAWNMKIFLSLSEFECSEVRIKTFRQFDGTLTACLLHAMPLVMFPLQAEDCEGETVPPIACVEYSTAFIFCMMTRQGQVSSPGSHYLPLYNPAALKAGMVHNDHRRSHHTR